MKPTFKIVIQLLCLAALFTNHVQANECVVTTADNAQIDLSGFSRADGTNICDIIGLNAASRAEFELIDDFSVLSVNYTKKDECLSHTGPENSQHATLNIICGDNDIDWSSFSDCSSMVAIKHLDACAATSRRRLIDDSDFIDDKDDYDDVKFKKESVKSTDSDTSKDGGKDTNVDNDGVDDDYKPDDASSDDDSDDYNDDDYSAFDGSGDDDDSVWTDASYGGDDDDDVDATDYDDDDDNSASTGIADDDDDDYNTDMDDDDYKDSSVKDDDNDDGDFAPTDDGTSPGDEPTVDDVSGTADEPDGDSDPDFDEPVSDTAALDAILQKDLPETQSIEDSAPLLGFRTLIWVLVVVVLYFAAMTALNVQYKNLTVFEAIPHKDALGEVPGLFKDGIIYSKDVTQEVFDKLKSKYGSRSLSSRNRSANGYTSV